MDEVVVEPRSRGMGVSSKGKSSSVAGRIRYGHKIKRPLIGCPCYHRHTSVLPVPCVSTKSVEVYLCV